jgi:3(or 17)beta-hydroxysteroid dehydrogenase
MDRLKGKVAIITGAAMGLGEADARLFAKEGAQVILADVAVEQGEKVAKEIGPQAVFMKMDVTKEAEWKKLIDTVMEKYGRLDILVNNAGIVEIHTPETITEEQYRRVMAVSIDGTVFGCKHAIAAMKKSGGGSIINMSSNASITGEPYVAAYSAAKGAVESYTRTVAVYCAQNRLKIRCNSVHPTGMETPMVMTLPEKVAAAGVPPLWEQEGANASRNPLGRPIDVAYLVLYLASDESVFMSGQQFILDYTATVTLGAVPGEGSLAARNR